MRYESNTQVIGYVKAIAAQKGVRLMDVAEALGMSQVVFSQYLHKKGFGLADLDRVAKALGMDLHFTFREIQNDYY